MELEQFSLVEIIRDPGVWIYEASELSDSGHYYLYRYDSGEDRFYRATVPAGAAAVHFFPLKSTERVPVAGWYAIERKTPAPFRPRLVVNRKSASA